MKFGFISFKADNFNAFLSQMHVCGINPVLIKDCSCEKDAEALENSFGGCDVVFGAGKREWFLNAFNLEDKGENSFCVNARIYIYLESTDNITGIEGVIKERLSDLNISMSVYRLYLEKERIQELETILENESASSKEKVLISKQKNGELIDVIIRYRSDSRTKRANKIILESYFNNIYVAGFVPLYEVVGSMLLKSGLKVRLAESFTGGGLSASLVRVAGASGFLVESLVTYTDESKVSRLLLNKETLVSCGAVTKQIAYEMAKSLYGSGCDIAVATTGNAGPTNQKGGAVGKCFISLVMGGKIEVNEYSFCGNRAEITQSGIDSALFLLYRKLMLSYTR